MQGSAVAGTPDKINPQISILADGEGRAIGDIRAHRRPRRP
jgi:hypothetical protein